MLHRETFVTAFADSRDLVNSLSLGLESTVVTEWKKSEKNIMKDL